MKRFAGWLALALVVIVIDQLTKQWVLASIPHGTAIPVTSFFDLVMVYNPGAAFSFLADHDGWQRWFFIVLAFVICGWLLQMLWQHKTERLQPLAFSLVIGGAIGNVIDRFLHHAVVDFLYFHIGPYGWPAFNAADSAICLGVGLMILAQVRESRAAARDKDNKETSA